jgi:hypothetical protein
MAADAEEEEEDDGDDGSNTVELEEGGGEAMAAADDEDESNADEDAEEGETRGAGALPKLARLRGVATNEFPVAPPVLQFERRTDKIEVIRHEK